MPLLPPLHRFFGASFRPSGNSTRPDAARAWLLTRAPASSEGFQQDLVFPNATPLRPATNQSALLTAQDRRPAHQTAPASLSWPVASLPAPPACTRASNQFHHID